MHQSLFVFEFITGGGLAGAALPPSLAREGALMRDALLRDALDLPDSEVIMLHDARCPPTRPGTTAIMVADAASFDAAFDHALARCDSALLVAPETGDLLASLARRVERAGRRLLGCDAHSCRIAASKSATAERLRAAGVAVIPHYRDAGTLPALPGAWAVKPDDGAGCEGLLKLADHAAARAALLAAGPGAIAQPWLDGEACSMNLLCARGRAAVLSVNRQRLQAGDGGHIKLAALNVGAVAPAPRHVTLASQIAAVLPGLLGPVGVDFIETGDGPVVVEINPRMSTSACALRNALDLNLIAATLDALEHGTLPSLDGSGAQEIVLQLETGTETG